MIRVFVRESHPLTPQLGDLRLAAESAHQLSRLLSRDEALTAPEKECVLTVLKGWPHKPGDIVVATGGGLFRVYLRDATESPRRAGVSGADDGRWVAHQTNARLLVVGPHPHVDQLASFLRFAGYTYTESCLAGDVNRVMRGLGADWCPDAVIFDESLGSLPSDLVESCRSRGTSLVLLGAMSDVPGVGTVIPAPIELRALAPTIDSVIVARRSAALRSDSSTAAAPRS